MSKATNKEGTVFYGKIRGVSVEFENDQEWERFCLANAGRKIYIEVGYETRQRTGKQNSSLHVGLDILADELNKAGLDMRTVLKQEIAIPWNGDTCKEYLYRPLMTAMLLKKSTTELTKDQISEVWEVLMRELGEKHEVEYIPFPSKETKHAV